MSIAELAPRSKDLTTYLQQHSADAVLKRNGFIEVPAGKDYLLPRITAIREGMTRMTDDPQGRDKFPWKNIVIDAYGERYPQEVGLKHTVEDEVERKFTFHYQPEITRMLPAALVREYMSFFNALYDLNMWSRNIALSVASCFDAANERRDGGPKYQGSLTQKILAGRRVIRVLRYRQKQDAEPDATVHVDRSCFTVHAWSSHRGLRMFTPQGESCPVEETSFSTAAVFMGEKFVALTRGIFGLGTPHGVYDERRLAGARSNEDRFAVVCFVHPQTHQDDAQWLLANWPRIVEYEKKFHL